MGVKVPFENEGRQAYNRNRTRKITPALPAQQYSQIRTLEGSAQTAFVRGSTAGLQADRLKAQIAEKDRVEAIRGPHTSLRVTRMKSRLQPVQDSMLGNPDSNATLLPVAVCERWNRGTAQTLTTSTYTTIQFGTSDVALDSAGYPELYDDATYKWTVPSGLSGIWHIQGVLRFASSSTGARVVRVYLNNSTDIWNSRLGTVSGQTSLPFSFIYPLSEGDYLEIQGWQDTGGDFDVVGGKEATHASMTFVGVG